MSRLDNVKAFKWLNLIGGIYEICFGILMIFFIQPLLTMLGVSDPDINFPIFGQTEGLLAIIFGILLICSTIDVERYLLIPVISVVLRIAIQFVILPNIVVLPEMTVGLIAFAMIDLVFGVMTLVLMKWCNFSIGEIFKPSN